MGEGAFSRWYESVDESLLEAARVAVRDVLEVKAGERALIVTNPQRDVHTISLALYDAIREVDGTPVLMVQDTKTQLDFADDAVIKALWSNPEIVISISHQKLGKDRESMKKPIKAGEKTYDHVFNYLLGEKKIRAFWSPTITIEMFKETVPIDYKKMRAEAAAVKDVLDRSVRVHIESPGGTDVIIGTNGRKAMADDGDFTLPGRGGNLPAGETFISPELGASSGRMVFDGSISTPDGEIIISTPIVCEVEDGFVTDISGGEEARKLDESIKASLKKLDEMIAAGDIKAEMRETYARNAYNLGELGIGLNPKARIVGNMLEDEKVGGTCHIALGANYDNDARALTHLDGLIKSPTITAEMADGGRICIMDKGRMTLIS